MFFFLLSISNSAVSPHGSELLKLQLEEHLHTASSQQQADHGDRGRGHGARQWVAAGDLLRWLHRKNAVRTGTLSTTDHYLIQDSYYIPPNWDHHIEHAFYR